MDTQDNILKGK